MKDSWNKRYIYLHEWLISMGSILMGSFMGSTHEMVDQAYVFLAICSSSFGIESKPLFFGGGQVYGIQHFFRQSGILFAYLVYV